MDCIKFSFTLLSVNSFITPLPNEVWAIPRGDTMIFIKKFFGRKIFFHNFILMLLGSLKTEK